MNRLWDVITDRYIQHADTALHCTASNQVLDCLMPDGPQSNFSRRDIYVTSGFNKIADDFDDKRSGRTLNR